MESVPRDSYFVQKRLRSIQGLAVRHLDLGNLVLGSTFNVVLTLSQTSPGAQPFLITDPVQNTANPTWEEISEIDGEQVDLSTSRCIFQLFLLFEDSSVIKRLLWWEVDLRALIRVGDDFNSLEVDFKPNTVVVLLKSGAYVFPHNLPNNFKPISPEHTRTVRKCCTPAALRQLLKLEKDLSQVRARKRGSHLALEESMTLWASRSEIIRKTETVAHRVKNLRGFLEECHQTNTTLLQSSEGLARQNESVAATLGADRNDLENKHRELEQLHSSVVDCRQRLQATLSDLKRRRCELVTSIKLIYPIHRSPSGRIFIAGIWLPPVDQYISCDDATLSASLGYTVHLVILLSKILDVPLRYPLKFYCSISSVTDHISAKLSDREREYPLHVKSRERSRFHYGVFFLNANITQLRLNFSLGTTNLKNTLDNLQNLMEERFRVPSQSLLQPQLGQGSVEPVSGFSPLENGHAGASSDDDARSLNSDSPLFTTAQLDFRRSKTEVCLSSPVFIPNSEASSQK